MTYDDWKATDTYEPEPNRCVTCNHQENYCDCPCCVEFISQEELNEERSIRRGEEYLQNAAAADTHSSDVDPGAVDPWATR